MDELSWLPESLRQLALDRFHLLQPHLGEVLAACLRPTPSSLHKRHAQLSTQAFDYTLPSGCICHGCQGKNPRDAILTQYS